MTGTRGNDRPGPLSTSLGSEQLLGVNQILVPVTECRAPPSGHFVSRLMVVAESAKWRVIHAGYSPSDSWVPGLGCSFCFGATGTHSRSCRDDPYR
ncbi:hypothetical protein RHA1_ro03504 [Rhodococcus jostii RHA1]|uniref:Uncharacterized protein n=1 Tax=Rhodococcus jostii (strain RHA1) TaxID=101510 RepID=Q0SAX9_RHOJR|nr:hypothetical protein RHA1_ro03504 [Rhodococcus jostii RHA1]